MESPPGVVTMRMTHFFNGRRLAKRRALGRAIVVALTAITFALLASLAASHLHIPPDSDHDCAVCAAFAGKLESPGVCVPVAPVSQVPHRVALAPAIRPAPAAPTHLLPPSRGPPPRP